jgi:phosphatidylinositol glycan class B
VTERRYLAVLLVATCVTAWFSEAYFHVDEYFQVLELARKKLDPTSVGELPWEHAERIRPWLQPFLYWALGRAFGIRDIFTLAFVSRLTTGLANVGALALWLRTTRPWFAEGEARRFHLQVTTLAGWLPYLFVRTSSESGSMAALTAALALVLDGAAPSPDSQEDTWVVPALERTPVSFLVGVLFGVAFELRFQTIFVPAGLAAWLVLRTDRAARTRAWKALAVIAVGGALVIALGALLDRWGYGVWTFPPWSYLRVNLFEGVAKQFGTYPLFAYLWMLPANVFFPVVVALILLLILAWARFPWHPLTWATLPFVLVHCLLSHKEERFLFPLAIVALTSVALAITPRAAARRSRTDVLAARAWGWRRTWPGKLLAGWSTAFALLLAFFPLGWNHHVRFFRALHDRFGDEVHATALPDVELFVPPFHPRVWDVAAADPDEVALRLAAESPSVSPRDEWLIAPLPNLPPPIAARAELVASELPGAQDPSTRARLVSLVDAYNAHADTPLRKLRYYTLYRLRPIAPRSAGP